MPTIPRSLAQPRWAGLLAGAALMVGLSLLGDTPDTRDSTDSVARYFVGQRTSVVIGVILISWAMVALLRQVASIGGALPPTHEQMSTFIQSVATVIVAVVLATMLVPYSALSYSVGAESPEMAKALFGITLIATPILAAPFAALTLTVGVASRHGFACRWFSALSTVIGAMFAITTIAYAANGPLSPDVQQQVLFELATLWLIASTIGIPRAAHAANDAGATKRPRSSRPA